MSRLGLVNLISRLLLFYLVPSCLACLRMVSNDDGLAMSRDLQTVAKETGTHVEKEVRPDTHAVFKYDREEYVVGSYGPIRRVKNITRCGCRRDIYSNEWCPHGMDKIKCARHFLTLPSDSESVFTLTPDGCSLTYDCTEDYKLFGNVLVPLGVYRQPSNLQKEIDVAQANGYSTAFECNREAEFELVFVSARRRIVFSIKDVACVRQVKQFGPDKYISQEFTPPPPLPERGLPPPTGINPRTGYLIPYGPSRPGEYYLRISDRETAPHRQVHSLNQNGFRALG